MRRMALFILVVVIAIAGVGYAAFYTFTRTIYDERSCGFANIDNIELHAKLDIPPTIDCECEFLDGMNIKNSVFTFDRGRVNLPDYIAANKFLPHAFNQSIPVDFAGLEKDPRGFKNRDGLYYRGGETSAATYRMLLDISNGKLYIILKYKS